MKDNKISNSIYLSFATLEIIFIYDLNTRISCGILWLLPLFLIAVPAFRLIKSNWQSKKE